MAYDQGLTLDDIRCGLLTYEGLAMRQQIHELDKITVIDDSYNASPDSIKSGIGVLMAVKSTGKKIAVLADMLELGERSAQAHLELGAYAGGKRSRRSAHGWPGSGKNCGRGRGGKQKNFGESLRNQ